MPSPLAELLGGGVKETNVLTDPDARVMAFFNRMGVSKPNAVTKAKAIELLRAHGVNLGAGMLGMDKASVLGEKPFYQQLIREGSPAQADY